MVKVIFTGDYTGKYGAGRSGEVRTISKEAFDHLKAKGLVNIYREKRTTKELKLTLETK